jgi:hypothetical protein
MEIAENLQKSERNSCIPEENTENLLTFLAKSGELFRT